MVSRYVKWRYIHVPVLPEKYIELVEKKGDKTWLEVIEKGLESLEKEGDCKEA